MTRQPPSPNTLQSGIAEIVSSLLAWELKTSDHRTSRTERTCHRLLDLRSTQPTDPKPASPKLAPFPQNDFLRDLRASSVPSVKNGGPQTLEDPEATPAHPQTTDPKPTSPNLASFRQNGFLSPCASITNRPQPQTPAPPARDTVEPVPPELPPAPVRLFLVDPHASPNS